MTQLLKKGDVVRCIDDAGHSVLTAGKQYDVLDTLYGNWILIINDEGVDAIYSTNCFEYSHIIPEKYLDEKNLPPGTTGKTNLESKPHLAYFDPHLEYEMGMGMRQGAIKHGFNNHRKLDVTSAQQILDSLKRHLNNYLCGEEYDEETGVNHLACAVNNINFIYRLNRLYGHEEVLNTIYGNTK